MTNFHAKAKTIRSFYSRSKRKILRRKNEVKKEKNIKKDEKYCVLQAKERNDIADEDLELIGFEKFSYSEKNCYQPLKLGYEL